MVAAIYLTRIAPINLTADGVGEMERVRTFTTAVQEFWQGVIEWRSPASAPYLMLVNMAFW
ncbi:unnamed protein product [Nippostrongylus brasiliensis]|uniref:ABC transporter permease n=1 Tax=Nippostrongylus brasiliensis TaxID=27835 RepID=A0A0N4Y973_NIPBR|nr:unnamed protein product [Nippostrongylus brasiliensis]